MQKFINVYLPVAWLAYVTYVIGGTIAGYEVNAWLF